MKPIPIRSLVALAAALAERRTAAAPVIERAKERAGADRPDPLPTAVAKP